MSYYDAPNIPFGLPTKFNANDFLNPPKENITSTNLDNRYLKKISNDITPFNLTCNKLTSNELESDLLTITGNSTFLSDIYVSSIATINNLNVSGNATFNSSLNISGLTRVFDDIVMNDKTILLRNSNQHGLKMAGGGASTFSLIDVDGPVLYGNGVCLGTGQGQGTDKAYLLIKNNNTSIMSNLNISGNTFFNSDVIINNNLTVSGISTIYNITSNSITTNSITTNNMASNNIASNNLSVNSSLNITGLTNFRNDIIMNDKTILLRSTNQHGLKIAGGGTSTFSGIDVDGPVLFGNGVCLGTGQGQGSDRAYLLIKNNNTSIMSNLNISGNANFNSDVIINNNLTVRGTTTTIDSTNVNIADNILLLNSNFTTGSLLSSFQSGLEVRRGSQLPYRFIFSESDDSFKIGVFNTSISDLQSVATRQDAPTINGLTFWNTNQSRLDTSSNLFVSGNSVFLSNLNVNSNLNVSGNTTLNNPTSINSSLMISGNTTINSDLTLSINKFTGGFGVRGIDNSGNVRPYNCPLYTRGFQAGIGLNYETFNESTTASFLRSGIQIISTNPETTWRTILETDAWGDNNRGSNIWFYTYNSANSANTRLGMTERLRITNNTTATSLTAGTVQITGGLAISDDIFCSSLNVLSSSSINSLLTISGLTNINSSLNVSNTTVLNDATSVNSSLTISGLTNINSSLSVSNTTVLNNATSINSSLNISGLTNINSSLNVSNTTVLNNATSISSTLYVNNNSTFVSRMNISGLSTHNGSSSFLSTLMISGNTTINSDLTLSINKFTGGFGVNGIDNSGNVRPYNCPLYTRGFQAGIGLNYETYNESTTASFLRSGIQIISTNPETTWRTILETDAWGDNNRGSNIWFYTYNSANSSNSRLGMTERLKITNNTTSTSLTAGTVQISGGLAVSDNISCSRLSVLNNTVLNTAVVNGLMTMNSNILLNDQTICMRSNTNSGLRMCGNGTNTMPMRFSNFNANGPVLYGAQGGVLGTNEGGTERISLQWGTIDLNISNNTQFRNNVFLNDKALYLSPDTNSGLRMCGDGTNTMPMRFSNFNANGPVLYGSQGGILGTNDGGTERISLQWGTVDMNISNNTQFRNNVFLNDKILSLRSDTNHGIRMCGGGASTFSNIDIDGPVIYGLRGGILGTTETTQKSILQWNENNVSINTSLNISGNTNLNSIDVNTSLNVSGTSNFRNNVFLNDKALYLRPDTNHALRICNNSNPFAGIGNIDGPALYGFGGGILGTTDGTQRSILQWNSNGVSIGSILNISTINFKQEQALTHTTTTTLKYFEQHQNFEIIFSLINPTNISLVPFPGYAIKMGDDTSGIIHYCGSCSYSKLNTNENLNPVLMSIRAFMKVPAIGAGRYAVCIGSMAGFPLNIAANVDGADIYARFYRLQSLNAPTTLTWGAMANSGYVQISGWYRY